MRMLVLIPMILTLKETTVRGIMRILILILMTLTLKETTNEMG
jgi:hypothetical protein